MPELGKAGSRGQSDISSSDDGNSRHAARLRVNAGVIIGWLTSGWYFRSVRLPAVASIRRQLFPLMMVAGAMLATWRFWSISGGRTFHFDEWAWVLRRNDFSIDALFGDHNGHLSVIPATVYITMFNVVGLSAYGAYMLLGYAVHFMVSVALGIVFRDRFGVGPGISVGLMFLFLGTISQNTLWPFQIGFMSSVLGYLVIRISLDRDTPRQSLFVFLGLLLSMGSSGVGIPVFAAVTVELIVRGWRGRRLVCVGIPFALYSAWYLSFSKSDTNFDFWDLIPKYSRDSAAAALAGIFGYTLDWGLLTLGVALGLLALAILKRPGASPAIIGGLVYVLLFWALTCLSRAQFWDVGAGRYIYAVLPPILVIFAEVTGHFSRRVMTPLILVTAALSIWGTWDRMNAEAHFYRSWGQSVAAELLALELHRESVPDNYFPDTVRAPDIFASSYFAATSKFDSSPAATVDELPSLMKDARIEFDRVSIELGDVRVSEYRGESTPCSPALPVNGRERIKLSAGTNLIRAEGSDVTVGFRRFANRRLDLFQTVIQKDSTVTIDVRPDSLTRQWVVVKVAGSGGMCASEEP